MQHLGATTIRTFHQLRLVQAAVVLAAALTRAGLRVLSLWIRHDYPSMIVYVMEKVLGVGLAAVGTKLAQGFPTRIDRRLVLLYRRRAE